jgi:hypothetical protein
MAARAVPEPRAEGRDAGRPTSLRVLLYCSEERGRWLEELATLIEDEVEAAQRVPERRSAPRVGIDADITAGCPPGSDNTETFSKLTSKTACIADTKAEDGVEWCSLMHTS